MKIPLVANTYARPYVLRCAEFNGAKNSLSDNGYAVSGRRHAHLYVVYSYGHWPMFVCDTRTDTWFINATKSTPTTSKQRGQTYPHGKTLSPLPVSELEKIIEQSRYAHRITTTGEAR